MEISYDKDADAMYIKLRAGTFAKNKKVNDFTILDLDDDDNVLGIELLDVSKHLPKDALKVQLRNLAVAQ